MKRSDGLLTTIPEPGKEDGCRMKGMALADDIGKQQQSGGKTPGKPTAAHARPAAPAGYVSPAPAPNADMTTVLPAKASGRLKQHRDQQPFGIVD
jgi:hypothetical protein